MKVHAVQLDQVWEDKEANYEKATRLINEAGVNKGDLIVLPETFPTCFSMNVELTTKNEPEKTEGFLSDLAKKYGAWRGRIFRFEPNLGPNLRKESE